ncbi:MAG: hypothetical protein ABEJ61_01440 [Haloferacaceae archaeon]
MSLASESILAVGFLALGVGVLSAVLDPATGYRVSLYRATPAPFWLGVGVAAVVAVLTAFGDRDAEYQYLGALLGGFAMVAVVGLPLLRGYHFYGSADPLTHLGWAKDLVAGDISPFAMIYPGVHTVTVLLAEVTGYSIARSMMVVVFAFVVLFLLVVPLAVHRIVRSRHAVTVGAFAAILLLPINHVSMHLRAHPFTQTVLFTALVLFLVVLYATRSTDDGGAFSASGVLLVVAALATILYHPQQATNVIVVLVALSALQFVVGRRRPATDLATDRPLYVPTAIAVAAYAAWTLPAEWFHRAVARHGSAVVGYLTGSPPQLGDRVASQSASLLAIGASPVELFLKLFLPGTVFVVLAGLFVARLATGSLDPRSDRERTVGTYLAVALVAMLPVFVVYVLASVAEMYFRHHGFIMLLVTLLGAVAVAHALATADGRSRRAFRVSLVAGMLVMLPLVGATVYQSPYIYKANQHVTEMQVTGYEASLEYADDEVTLAGIRSSATRFSDAVHGVRGSTTYDTEIEGRTLRRLPSAYEGGGYLVVTEADRKREVVAYRGLRYTRDQFASLDDQASVNVVFANGEVTMYQVPG